MVLFAPIIHVLQYLGTSGLPTEEIRSRAVGFLELGELVQSFFLDTFSRAYDRLISYWQVHPLHPWKSWGCFCEVVSVI